MLDPRVLRTPISLDAREAALAEPLRDTAQRKLFGEAAFWPALFAQSTPHPLDTHPSLSARLDALGVRFRLLPEILRHSDILSLHVPLNDSTRHMIGKQELAVMKKSAIIVNTSRGPVIDEKAMTEALSRGDLFGAGLDVFDEEPTPPNNPLLKLDNVILTAHLAGPTWESNITRLRNGFDNVQRVARGEKPLWVVEEMWGKI